MKCRRLFYLLHFAFFELQNEIVAKSSAIFDSVLTNACKKVRTLPNLALFCGLNSLEMDGRLWKKLLIVLITFRKKLEKQKIAQNLDVGKCSIIQTFDINLLL